MAQKLQRIGAVARSTATVSEAVRREVIAQRLPSHDWPDRELRITAIDIGTGELVSLRPGVGSRAGRRGRRQLRGAGRVAAGDDRRAAIHGRRCRQHDELEAGRRLRHRRRVGAVRQVGAVAVRSRPGRRGRRLRRPLAGGVRRRRIVERRSARTRWTRACREPSARAGRAQGRRVAAEVAEFLAASVYQASRASMACAANSWPMSMTSAARWNSRLRQTVRGTSISRSGG